MNEGGETAPEFFFSENKIKFKTLLGGGREGCCDPAGMLRPRGLTRSRCPPEPPAAQGLLPHPDTPLLYFSLPFPRFYFYFFFFFPPSILAAITAALPCSPLGPFPFSHPSPPFPSLCSPSQCSQQVPGTGEGQALPEGDIPSPLRVSQIWGALGDSAVGPVSLCSSTHRASPPERCPWEH